MRLSVVVLSCVLGSGVAFAQQAAPPPQPYPPQPQYPQQQYPQQQYPQPYGPQAGYAYPAQQQPMNVQLTVDEKWLLERGYITDGEHIGGGVAAVFIGFGVGQAIQGRWSEKGWIFTFGELASMGLMIYGMVQFVDTCASDPEVSSSNCDRAFGRAMGLMLVGSLATGAFRIWETIDAFVAPSQHNRDLRALQMRLGMPVPMYSRLTPFVVPTHDGDGGVAGVSLRF